MTDKIQGKLFEAMSHEMTPKFLATVGPDGLPNVVLIATIEPNGEDKMIYADFLMHKTGKNIEQNAKVGVCVVTEQLEWWSMTADHTGWEKTGELVDQFNSKELFRYNAYTGVRRVGKMSLRSFAAQGKVSKLGLLTEFLSTRTTLGGCASENHPNKMPGTVKEKFGRLQAIKVISYIGADGYPVIVPILAAQPADNATLVLSKPDNALFADGLSEGVKCAVNVVSMEPVSYQIKGEFGGWKKTLLGQKGSMTIESVWCTSPPLCGERIDEDLK